MHCYGVDALLMDFQSFLMLLEQFHFYLLFCILNSIIKKAQLDYSLLIHIYPSHRWHIFEECWVIAARHANRSFHFLSMYAHEAMYTS